MSADTDMVKSVFPAETSSHIRAYMRQKLNNADKGCKRKFLKGLFLSDTQSE